MAHFIALLAAIFAFSMLIPGTEPLQPTNTQMLLQLKKQLEYPKQLDAWNYIADLCYAAPSPNYSVICDGDSVIQLKIVGDMRVKALGSFNGYSISNKTLSPAFSLDSFVTTLTRLTSLKVVVLVSLGIWGPLPDKIHRLYSLEVLDLSSNFLYGSIPPKISVMTRLQTFSLEGNYFNDTVPDWFSAMSNLTVLSLQNNHLKGPLPESIGRISNLSRLALSGNSISGKLPMLSGLNHLQFLDLRDNRIYSELTDMPIGLVTILLSNNSLTGEIPQQFGELNQLQHLELSSNMLEGTPPEALFSLRNINYLNLASNMLSGSLPSSLTCNNQLSFVDISKNRFTGILPSCLVSKSSKRVVKFNDNCFSQDQQHQHEAKYCEVNHMDQKSSKSKGATLMIAVIGGISVIVLFILVVSLVLCRRKWQTAVEENHLSLKQKADSSAKGFSSGLLANARNISEVMNLGSEMLPSYRVFSLDELKEATNNFEPSTYISEGSTGKLFKGRLENGTFIVIRCLALLKRYSIRNLKFRLDLISKLRHPHLVCLLGHCIDDATNDSSVERVFLIYEYVANGNLRAHLSESSLERPLRWTDRLAVLTGIAKAVHFLHAGTIPGSFNNRLKTNNILLTEHLIAKVSDYGLSIISEEIYKHQEKTEAQKPVPSQSPELEVRDMEDDIYSFGLILLESLVGVTLFNRGREYCRNELAVLCSNQAHEKDILDPIVLASSSQESLSIVVSMTNKCLSQESSRPSVEDVLWNLQYAAQIQATADRDQKSDVVSQASLGA